MANARRAKKLLGFVLLCSFLWSCAGPNIKTARVGVTPQVKPKEEPVRKQGPPDMGCTKRVVSEDELLKLSEKDPDLTLDACRKILARLNTKAVYHVSGDIRKGRPLKVPNDFAAYKNWSPLPARIDEIAGVPKLILVAKEVPFLGWYENGVLKGDTYVCLGKKWDMTEAGVYKVEDKHAEYFSRSYPDAYGQPASMPWSMRIYGGVYIHEGDVTEGYCSPGCVELPPETAEKLFHWAPVGTPVVVLDSLDQLRAALRVRSTRLRGHPIKKN
jgi:lipoprotein-anchoring transpeptidase ErfK/SrfK